MGSRHSPCTFYKVPAHLLPFLVADAGCKRGMFRDQILHTLGRRGGHGQGVSDD